MPGLVCGLGAPDRSRCEILLPPTPDGLRIAIDRPLWGALRLECSLIGVLWETGIGPAPFRPRGVSSEGRQSALHTAPSCAQACGRGAPPHPSAARSSPRVFRKIF